MAAQGRRKGTSVADILFREPFRFQFVQAVRLLEALERETAERENRTPRQPVGGDSHPEDEVVRFRASQSHDFPASEVVTLRVPPSDGDSNAGAPPEMSVAFMGYTGASGVLPDLYDRVLSTRLREGDSTLRDFLDTFNHRSVSLFYRAAVKYYFPTGYETARNGAEEDTFTTALYSLVGIGTKHLRGRLTVGDESLAHYAGHLSHFPRSASGLESMLGGYFGVNVVVEQFRGQWLYFDPDQQSRFAGAADRELTFNRLGVDTVLGERVWDVQGKFRIVAGPLSIDEFEQFLPAGKRFTQLAHLTRTYAGIELAAELQLVLRAEDVPSLELSEHGGTQPMLGWNTWLSADSFESDADDVVLSLELAGPP